MYWEILYIKLFPYTKVTKSSLSAPHSIVNSSISNSFPIPKLLNQACQLRGVLGIPLYQATSLYQSTKSMCGYRRKNAFSVFLSKSLQKHRLFSHKLLAPMSKVCVPLLASSKAQTLCNTLCVHHIYSLCILTFIFKYTETT